MQFDLYNIKLHNRRECDDLKESHDSVTLTELGGYSLGLVLVPVQSHASLVHSENQPTLLQV